MKDWLHQEEEFREHWTTESRALLWEPRTGKSKSIIDKACALFQACAIDGVLVFAPNGVHRNWTLKQIPQHHWPGVPYRSHAWRIPEGEANILAALRLTQPPFNTLDWLTINMEVTKDQRTRVAVWDFVKSHPNFFLVVDEAHHFARPGSKRTKYLRGLGALAAYRTILTGTSVEETPFQAYSQFQILQEGALGYTDYDKFQRRYATFKIERRRGHSFPVVDEYQNLEELKARMARFSSVVLREQCEDIPGIMIDPVLIELTEKQRDLYYRIKANDIDTLIEYGFPKALEGGAMLTKLQQIEGGYLKTPNGVKFIDESPKFNVVLEETKGYTSLVWAVFRHEVEEVTKYLKANDINAALIYGGSPNRDGVLQAFEAGRLQTIVAEPHSIGEGYEVLADKTLWFSQTPSGTVRTQANQRTTKAGTKKKQVLDIFAPDGVDERWLYLTDNKIELADYVSKHGLQKVIEELRP